MNEYFVKIGVIHENSTAYYRGADHTFIIRDKTGKEACNKAFDKVSEQFTRTGQRVRLELLDIKKL